VTNRIEPYYIREYYNCHEQASVKDCVQNVSDKFYYAARVHKSKKKI